MRKGSPVWCAFSPVVAHTSHPRLTLMLYAAFCRLVSTAGVRVICWDLVLATR